MKLQTLFDWFLWIALVVALASAAAAQRVTLQSAYQPGELVKLSVSLSDNERANWLIVQPWGLDTLEYVIRDDECRVTGADLLFVAPSASVRGWLIIDRKDDYALPPEPFELVIGDTPAPPKPDEPSEPDEPPFATDFEKLTGQLVAKLDDPETVSELANALQKAIDVKWPTDLQAAQFRIRNAVETTLQNSRSSWYKPWMDEFRRPLNDAIIAEVETAEQLKQVIGLVIKGLR